MIRLPKALLLVAAALASACCSAPEVEPSAEPAKDATAAPSDTSNVSETPMNDTSAPTPSRTETATFGAGCYWCVEAVLEQVDGVLDVKSGFMGGSVEDPTYEQVCSGTTGHAEVVQVTFDPSKISYEGLLEWFWQLHDPTTLNRQGNDVGPQYRSAIFYHSDAQRAAAIASMEKAQSRFLEPIVTEIAEAGTFYEAKADHQDYYRANKRQGYCRFVIAPKLEKLGLEK